VPDLDELLREAAGEATVRTRQGDFDAVVRGARRRRGRLAAAGAAGLVAVVALGVAVVAGRPGAQQPPAPPAATASPSAVTSEELVRSAGTDIPYIAWTFESDAARRGVFKEISRTRTPAAKNYFWYGGGTDADIRKEYPQAPTSGWFTWLTANRKPTRAQAEQFAADLRSMTGVRDAQLQTTRGYWFTLTVTVEGTVSPGNRRGLGPLPFDPRPQRSWGEKKMLGGGQEGFACHYIFVLPELDADTLQRIRLGVAEQWDTTIEATDVTPIVMEP